MKNIKDIILIYVLFIAFCITSIIYTVSYVDFFVFSESFTETRIMYHENIDDAISSLRDIEKDIFFKYYKLNDINILLYQYEDIRKEMISYNTSPLLYVIVEETFKISNKYGNIPIKLSIIDKIY